MRRVVPDLTLLFRIGGGAQVGVIQVQTSRLGVMIVQFVQVRRAGHEA